MTLAILCVAVWMWYTRGYNCCLEARHGQSYSHLHAIILLRMRAANPPTSQCFNGLCQYAGPGATRM